MIEAALKGMAEFRILADKDITLVPHDVLTQALARIAVDENISGTLYFSMTSYCKPHESKPAHTIFRPCNCYCSWGAIDIGDNTSIEEGYGSSRLVDLMTLRKEAGDFRHS